MVEQPLQAHDLGTLASVQPENALWDHSPACRDNVQPKSTPKSEQDDHARVDWTAIGLLLGAAILTILWHVLLRSSG